MRGRTDTASPRVDGDLRAPLVAPRRAAAKHSRRLTPRSAYQWRPEVTIHLANTARPAHRRGAAGFTFVEVLAAMLFLGIVVPTILTALTISNRASEMTDRGTAAGQLAENKLNEMLIGNAWQGNANASGDFGPQFPGYHWRMTQETWSGDSAAALTQLTIEVFYPTQGSEHSVTLTTLANTLATSGGTTGGTSLP